MEGWVSVRLTVLCAIPDRSYRSVRCEPTDVSFEIWPSSYRRPVVPRPAAPGRSAADVPRRSRTAGYTVRMPQLDPTVHTGHVVDLAPAVVPAPAASDRRPLDVIMPFRVVPHSFP